MLLVSLLSLNQVSESNETNNIASHPGPDFC